MKHISHKILAVFMTYVVLFSTMSFTLSMHYCEDDLINFSLIGKAAICDNESHGEHCNMDSTTDTCSMESMQESSCEKDKDCCTDKEIKVKKSQKDLKNNNLTGVSLKQNVFLIAFVYTYTNQFISDTKNNTTFFNYHPPPLIKSIYKLDEVYII